MMTPVLDTSRVAIIGPGRLGTAFAYKFGRDNKRVAIYYHDAEVCETINKDHLNPLHLTEDLANRLGGMDKVPRLSPKVYATNDLEHIVENYDFIILAITMNRLPDFLNYLKPMIDKKAGDTCLVSPIKGLISDEITKELITPSQLIGNHLYNLKHKYQIVCIGGPFFDIDIALGNPVCLTIAGRKSIANIIREDLIKFNRREMTSYYNFDVIGVEACGALKNIVANIKGLTDSLQLGDSIPGTIFARSGVEIRSLSRLLGGAFRPFTARPVSGICMSRYLLLPARIIVTENIFTNFTQATPLKPICAFWKNRRYAGRSEYRAECLQIPGKEEHVQSPIFLRLQNIQ